ncbi:DNA gyrase subunit A [Butyricicoccus porcorum]|uniref:DNA gyrase subunit A n=1 Tax=Butyricicoccus porcorum TaxID=1945634 RepID=A0A252F4R9_9FIRM|nr:DNA gyrase subunit A [Butyricicoccus porcorum]MDD6987246.1 DNA gyrase subunit A [Butyricicoccus porcorum]MDY4483742.1 DNA gyrase subunit A [Butyricicoccus porcorum]OUM20763.1 DNA gyrase subunit A [Butyricicoccus porcorum]
MSISFENQKIIPVDLEREMKKSYIDYAMSVIVGRALPDARDGLKPVHRRILYAMYEDHLTCDRPYRKSATTVGNVLGRYHPHGDASVYDALVRMAQPFSLRYPMIDGHGNFGSIDGDPPAAYRYTEARMSKMAAYMMTDIEKETVDFMPNFDDNRKEPKVLPSRFPGMLVNGSSGIAVGMATNMPPHNLTEVINGICYVIDNPDAQMEDICQYIKGPDFPTGGIIMGRSGIRAAYATGRGKIKVRARTEIEEMHNGRQRIVVTEIPYMVNKARLVESIADLVKNKRVEGISDLRDESDREGMRIVVELKREANAQVVLNQLFNYTQLQDTFSVNNLALVNNQPRTLNLRELIDQYIEFQREVIERRTRFDLNKAEGRAHILEGLKVATDNIDRIIEIIRASANESEAKTNLMAEPFIINQIALLGIVGGKENFEFHLDEPQAQAIVNMRLGRLSGLERQKINDEYDEIESKIRGLMEVLASRHNMLEIVKKELVEIRDKFGDERRTQIEAVDNEIDIEDLIEREDCTYTLTHCGYIKRTTTDTYRSQRRGGRGVSAMATREEDFAEILFTASSHDNILFFSSLGKVYRLKGYQIPETSRTAKGTNVVNLLALENGETVSAMFAISDYDESHYLFFTTEQGTVKRVALSELKNIRKAGLRALSLNEGDRLVDVRLTDGTQNMLIVTAKGHAICFDENEVRAMGRSAVGVRGITLEEGDRVIGGVRARPEGEVLTVTENGYGKRTPVGDFSIHHRGGRGILAHALNDKTGNIAGTAVVDLDNDVMIITDDGVLIRTAVEDIRQCGRNTQGVIVMRTGDDVHVNAITRIQKEEDEDPADIENPEETSEAEVEHGGEQE